MNAVFSQVEIIKSYIRHGNDEEADAAVNKLITTFTKQPTLPEQIYNVARKYEEYKKYDKAFKIYQYNFEKYPDGIPAMMSLTGIAKHHIREGEESSADAAYEKLLTMFSKQPTLPQQVHYVARKYEELKKYDKALKLYQNNVDSFPHNEYTMWSQVRIVRTHILNGDNAAADTAFNKLLTLFSEQPTLSREVYKIAKKFSEAGNDQKARQLYQYVIDRWSNDADIHSRNAVVMSYIHLGLDAQAQSATESLTKDFKDHNDLSFELWQSSEAYYTEALKYKKQGQVDKAKEYFAKVIISGEGLRQQSTPFPAVAEAWFFSADCYHQLGQSEKAIEYYQKVADNWPDYKYAWIAQYRIVQRYKSLLRKSDMSDSAIHAKLAEAYQRLVQKYPDCPAAKAARNWLENYAKSEEGGQK